MCFKAKPTYFIYIHILCVMEACLTCGSVIVNKFFYDSVHIAFLEKYQLTNAVKMLLVFAIVHLLGEIIESMKNFAVDTNTTRLLGYLYDKIAEKAISIEPINFEDPKELNSIYKAQNGADSAVHFQFTCTMILMFYIPYLLFMSSFLFSLKPVLVFAILFVFIPTIVSHILRISVYMKLEDEVTPFRREYDAYKNSIVSIENLKETRNLGAFGYFKYLLMNTQQILNGKMWKANKKSNKIDAFFSLLSLLGYCGVLFLLVVSLLDGSITVGAFAAVYSSIGTVFMIMEGMIRWDIGNLSEHFGKICNFLKFMDTPVVRKDSCQVNKKGDVELKNVSFRYPNAKYDSLSDINITIQEGETIAIVGRNGAGKTTLSKLLMGLYRPTSGKLTYDGKDISNTKFKVLFERISGVFQKFQKYKMTLEDNIRISDFSSKDEINMAIKKVDVDMANRNIFPNGKETILSREFDGVDLSGGQWQRIAIARGLYRESDLIILDEPTAAIDPIEESEIYKKFVDIAKDRTTIIITHRLGSAKIANRIIVLEGGRVVQIGSHDELLSKPGLYLDMYMAQSKWYQE